MEINGGTLLYKVDTIKLDKHQLYGAVICFESRSPQGVGHVAVVEEINAQTGEITCSNSAYEDTYFYLTHITPVNGRYDTTNFIFQGFIYCYDIPTPPTPTQKREGFPWVLYARKLKNKRM